ncbi:hypothetical protein H4217_005786 [Coemansia sp. RSA 1939]|nr:hypothetical protein H4217_005786 [Coemansia sp. RSA 1939]KAJ2612267.1 hypothetical protein EV177_003088 [Coemansia sp. RSA 1804]KAJ2676469.1 hypothetical protein GGH99_005855 [Coemansia sp. RSA 1285]
MSSDSSASSHGSEISAWKESVVGKTSVLRDRMDGRQITLLDQSIRPYLPPQYPNYPRDTKVGDVAVDAVLPPAAHLVYFPSHTAEPELAPDGYHADEAPPPPFVQRVWAGGLIEFSPSNPLRVGHLAAQTKQIEAVDIKERAGANALVFVTLLLDMHNEAGLCVRERRDLAYMVPTNLQRKIVSYNKQPDFSHAITPSEILLFRYSALSWNSHRIHYDAPYACGIENHPGLLVHGPLTCTLLLQLLQSHMPAGMALKTFDYRAISPLYCGQSLSLNGRWIACDDASETSRCELWVTNNEGGISMKGVATLVRL